MFEEGTKLTAYCTKALKNAEQKIVKLTAPQEETDGTADKTGEPPADEQENQLAEEA